MRRFLALKIIKTVILLQRVANLAKVLGKTLCGEMVFDLRVERWERGSYVNIWGKKHPSISISFYISKNIYLIYISKAGGTSGKGLACQCRRHKRCRFSPGSGRSCGEGHGNPLQYSYLENPMNRGTWHATVHRVMQSLTWLKWLSTHSTFHIYLFILFQSPWNINKLTI